MDIRIQLLPTNEVPQESAKTRPGISDLGVHVSVLAPLPAVGADTLTGNISNICHQLPILPHTAHSSLQLQSSISTTLLSSGMLISSTQFPLAVLHPAGGGPGGGGCAVRLVVVIAPRLLA